MADREYRLCMVHGDKFIDHFMRGSGVFESFKVVAAPTYMTVTLLPGYEIEPVIDRMRKDAQKTMVVVALFVPGTGIGWVDDTIKAISDGEHFGPAEDALWSWGWRPAEVTV